MEIVQSSEVRVVVWGLGFPELRKALNWAYVHNFQQFVDATLSYSENIPSSLTTSSTCHFPSCTCLCIQSQATSANNLLTVNVHRLIFLGSNVIKVKMNWAYIAIRWCNIYFGKEMPSSLATSPAGTLPLACSYNTEAGYWVQTVCWLLAYVGWYSCAQISSKPSISTAVRFDCVPVFTSWINIRRK